MHMPILATKLYIPLSRAKIVLRHRLIERLNDGLFSGSKLTLISASAGFGKTTLISEWVAGCGRPVAWISLDEGDNDIARLLTYLVAALQTITANIGTGVSAALHSPQQPPIEAMLTSLLNDVTTVPDPFILVLDDYHLIDANQVDQALSFLIEHQPPQMHLVIATREDPTLPLPRLRVRSQITELRAADLRFNPSEAADFLNHVMKLNLRPEDITALEIRTEGWIAGLQMAAISMQGRDDTLSFIQAFTGSHRFVLDYLVEEVLQRQPEHIRNFLLKTAILERLYGPLCDAITGQDDGREMLAILERSNLFVIPLDDQRQWYRYHHLFAEVLLAHAQEEQPSRIHLLHKRASAWFEQNDHPAEAIHHALVAKDFEYAAGMIEKAYPSMDASFNYAAWLGWVRKLPDEVLRSRPVLSFDYARAFMDSGEFDAGKFWLEETEKRLADPSEGMIVEDEAQFHNLPVRIALARSLLAQVQGDIGGAVKYAELALELSPEEDSYNHAMAAVTLGMAYLLCGDLDKTQRALSVWMDYCQKVGKIVYAIATSGYLAGIIVAQGRLREAERTYKQSIQLASTQDQVSHVTTNLYLGLGLLYHEQGDQQSAAQHLQKSGEIGKQVLIDWPYHWRLAQAQMKEAEGDLETALNLLEEARRFYVRTSIPDFRPIDALKARVYLRQGRWNEALTWARESGLSVNDDLSYLKEFEHITLARILIAQYKNAPLAGSINEAVVFLERLLQAADAGGRIGRVIEILVVQALAHQAQGNFSQSLASLERALTLAEPEDFVRIFVDEGEAMQSLIENLSRNQEHPLSGYMKKLLAAFTRLAVTPKSTNIRQKPDMQETENKSVIYKPVEPLSERELEVLRLLRSELSGPEIAGKLVVSLNTLRTHTKNIYYKLGVNNRRAAILRAEELDLF